MLIAIGRPQWGQHTVGDSPVEDGNSIILCPMRLFFGLFRLFKFRPTSVICVANIITNEKNTNTIRQQGPPVKKPPGNGTNDT